MDTKGMRMLGEKKLTHGMRKGESQESATARLC